MDSKELDRLIKLRAEGIIDINTFLHKVYYFKEKSSILMSFEEDIKQHLEDCTEFEFLELEVDHVHGSCVIKCSCNQPIATWIGTLESNNIEELKNFVESANMFAHNIREKARKNNVPLDELIEPLLGFCFEDLNFEAYTDG